MTLYQKVRLKCLDCLLFFLAKIAAKGLKARDPGQFLGPRVGAHVGVVCKMQRLFSSFADCNRGRGGGVTIWPDTRESANVCFWTLRVR